MSTHIGKIGRLSQSRREELGERMEDGQTGKELAEWLNSLPDVQALLKEKFGGLPGNEQNTCPTGGSLGHLEWLRLREGPGAGDAGWCRTQGSCPRRWPGDRGWGIVWRRF